jgi:hypothetical protein
LPDSVYKTPNEQSRSEIQAADDAAEQAADARSVARPRLAPTPLTATHPEGVGPEIARILGTWPLPRGGRLARRSVRGSTRTGSMNDWSLCAICVECGDDPCEFDHTNPQTKREGHELSQVARFGTAEEAEADRKLCLPLCARHHHDKRSFYLLPDGSVMDQQDSGRKVPSPAEARWVGCCVGGPVHWAPGFDGAPG